MFKNYLKIAWRNLWKNKTYSFINIFGLAIGLAGFITLLLYLNHELSYDTWDPSLAQVYKISSQTDEGVQEMTPAPLANLLMKESPMVEAATAIQPNDDYEVLLEVDDKKIYQTGGVTADSLFFDVFPYKVIVGNGATALNRPDAIVITSTLAKKLFGDENPIGKRIKISNFIENEVTAVMQEPETPSYLNAQFVFRVPYEKNNLHWGNHSYKTYVKTAQPVAVEKLEDDVDYIYYNARLHVEGQSLQEFRKAGHSAGLFVDAFQDLHNYPNHGSSNFKTVSILFLLAILLLLAGAINFSNLSIAASVRRAREVGVRKVLGSNRKQLLLQFMIEMALQCLASLVFALLIVGLILPFFNQEFNLDLTLFRLEGTGLLWLQIGACLLAVTILSGLYPSLFLSRYNTTKVLKGDYSRGKKGTAFRNALIVVQFTVSAFFIIGTLVIGSQMRYMQSRDKGFSGEQVVRLQANQKTRDKDFDVTRQRLMDIHGVQFVSKTTAVPGDQYIDTSVISFQYQGEDFKMNSVKISSDYFSTLDIDLKEGRLFTNSYADQNTQSAIINETAARRLEVANPIGTTITFPNCDSVPVQIVGIVEDFNVTGLENRVQPAMFTIGNKACRFQSGGAILVKLDGGNIQQSIAGIEQEWATIEPDFPIRYSFLDQNFQRLFSSYKRIQKIIQFFSFIAILIAVMGLFALSAFLINQRTKEIGIRIILGASIGDLSLLLGGGFLRLVIIAVLIAIPLSWWAAREWLQSFAYHISLNASVFLIAFGSILLITVLTVGYHILRAGNRDPAIALRSE